MRSISSIVTVLLVAGSVTAGCGSGDRKSSDAASNKNTAAATKDSAAAALVPTEIKSKGTLTVGTEGDYPPGSFVAADGKTLIGTDIDFSNAIAGVLGLKAQLQVSKFDTLIPGIQDKRFDMAASGIFDTKEREKVVDFVVYLQTGTQFYTKSGTSKQYSGLTSLCGARVAVLSGSVEFTGAQEQKKKCDVKILSFADQNAANLAVSSGRADVGFVDSPLAGYLVKQSNAQFQLSGEAFGIVPNGLAVPKGSALAKAVQAAVQILMKNGTYDRILKKWGATSDAVKTVVVNGATN